jgi:predicted ArsR family transcriptional regulator
VQQREIDFDSLSRRTDPPTSRKAAASAKVSESHQLVIEALAASPVPLTSFEIAAELSGACSPSRVRGALAELYERGELLVDDLGRSEYGRQCSRYSLKR